MSIIGMSASCHHSTRDDSGWSWTIWISHVWPDMIAKWHQRSHVPFFSYLFDRLPVKFRPRTFTIGFYRKKIYLSRAYDFRVQLNFQVSFLNWRLVWWCTACWCCLQNDLAGHAEEKKRRRTRKKEKHQTKPLWQQWAVWLSLSFFLSFFFFFKYPRVCCLLPILKFKELVFICNNFHYFFLNILVFAACYPS